jgi:hypothetical protein
MTMNVICAAPRKHSLKVWRKAVGWNPDNVSTLIT